MNCDRCGSEIPEGKKFCADCGAPAPQFEQELPRKSPFARKLQMDSQQDESVIPEQQTQIDSQQIENSPFTKPVQPSFNQIENSPFVPLNQLASDQPTNSPFVPAGQVTIHQPELSSTAQPIQPVFQKPVDQQFNNRQDSFQQPSYQQQPVYQEPAYQQPYNNTPVDNAGNTGKRKKGIAFILGLAALLLSWLKYVNVIVALVAIVISIIGLCKKNYSKAASIIGLCLALLAFFIGSRVNSTKKQTNTTQQSQVEVSAVADTESSETETTATESEKQLSFDVASGTTDLAVGEIAKDGDIYYGLSCVRSLDRVQTAIDSYSVEISDTQEVIYPIIEIYNGDDSIKNFAVKDISVYADSVKGTDPDTFYLVGVDGIDQLHSYKIDPDRTALVVDAFVVDKGWSELKIFCGEISWTLTPDDINTESYTFSSIYNLSPDFSYTEVGTVIYDEDYELTYDGLEIYETGNGKYVVFEYTVNNTSDNTLDYSMVGYSMVSYWNNQLLDEAIFTLDDSINGYANVFDVDEIHAGMTAKVYVAFEIYEDVGVFECYFDTGYIVNERIGYVCAENRE